MKITREIFDQQRRPRFGTSNPEPMQLAFWEWMIRGDERPHEENDLSPLGAIVREGKLKSIYGPYRARDFFNIPMNREDGQIWTFDRMGATRTRLTDGRIVCIGGEHEDFYDPDFYIYNDVVVFERNDQIEIYGYPRDIFPPTDFHTATVVVDQIIVVGGLGYKDARRTGYTPVYAVNTSNYRFSGIETCGEMPGWISEHEAEVDLQGIITIRKGQVIEEVAGKQRFRQNLEDYSLDTRSGVWRQVTKRNWQQFSVRREDRKQLLWNERAQPVGRRLEIEAFLPVNLEYAVLPGHESDDVRIVVDGVTVSVKRAVSKIEITVEGQLPEKLSLSLAEEIRTKAEAAVGGRCLVERL